MGKVRRRQLRLPSLRFRSFSSTSTSASASLSLSSSLSGFWLVFQPYFSFSLPSFYFRPFFADLSFFLAFLLVESESKSSIKSISTAEGSCASCQNIEYQRNTSRTLFLALFSLFCLCTYLTLTGE